MAEVSYVGNEKHNPGEPLHWSRDKSADHADAMLRHFKDRGKVDPENGCRHSAEMAWRALAILQEELEAAGAPLARGARRPEGGRVGLCGRCGQPFGLLPPAWDENLKAVHPGCK